MTKKRMILALAVVATLLPMLTGGQSVAQERAVDVRVFKAPT